MTTQLREIPLSAIRLSETNPRTHFPEGPMGELTESIKSHGVMSPILVRPLAEPVPKKKNTSAIEFEIVAGERRYRAAAAAMLETIPCLVRSLTDVEAIELQIVENLQRQDVDATEEATGFDQLQRLTKATPEDIAAKIGKSRSYVYTSLRLLTLPASAWDAIRMGLTRSHIELLLPLSKVKHQEQAIERMLAGPPHDPGIMSFRAAKKMVRDGFTSSLNAACFQMDEAYGSLIDCNTCPKRSGNCAEALAEHHGDPDVCTDVGCFETKHQLWLDGKAEAIRKHTGATVIISLNCPKGYLTLDAMIEGKQRTELRDLIALSPQVIEVTHWLRQTDGFLRGIVTTESVKHILANNVREAPLKVNNQAPTQEPLFERDLAAELAHEYTVEARKRAAEEIAAATSSLLELPNNLFASTLFAITDPNAYFDDSMETALQNAQLPLDVTDRPELLAKLKELPPAAQAKILVLTGAIMSVRAANDGDDLALRELADITGVSLEVSDIDRALVDNRHT